jgi:transcriptional regulator with XRE-family HTH domain
MQAMQKEERQVAARVAAEVRRARLAHGWSQLALAEKAGLSMNYVGMVERAEHLPTVRVLLRIGRTLGIKVGELINDSVQRAEPAEATDLNDPWLSEMLVLLRGLPLDARPVAAGVLRGVAEATPPRSKRPSPRSKVATSSTRPLRRAKA